MQEDRVFKINNKEQKDNKTVLYWMNRDMRNEDNFTLLYAQEIALKKGMQLFVVYNLVYSFLDGGYRQWIFKIEALKKIEKEFEKLNIPFFIILDEQGKTSSQKIVDFIEKNKISVLVTDFSPLKIHLKWQKEIAQKIEIPFFEVDTHNIIPARKASDKQEFAAYTFRPKVKKLLTKYLTEIPQIKKHKYNKKENTKNNWKEIEKITKTNKEEINIGWIKSGTDEAKKVLKIFLKEKLDDYGIERNDPEAEKVSNLSPYLHYGMISAQRIALEVLKYTKLKKEDIFQTNENKAKIKENIKPDLADNARAYLEELIVRKELSDNFCLYNKDYDNTKGFPLWAQKSHTTHSKDKREYVYTLKEFEQAKTHDDLWNACQKEMVKNGKMHGYMRMYWAKKILEWTKNPEDAMKIAIYLNDKYELDGRDPNGYAGIAWSIGGVHDRAWFPRPIFGNIRYMARSGCEKKFDVKQYIQKFNQNKLF